MEGTHKTLPQIIMNDKEIELIADVTSEETSDCCGAEIILGFCSDCKEHCQ